MRTDKTRTNNTQAENVEDLFHVELKDVYDAEKRLTKALPKMAKAAESDKLRSAIEDHLEETNGHVGRLEEIFELIGQKPTAKACEGMKGLISEGEHGISEHAQGLFRDLVIIGAARRVEHYEMACYMTLSSVARNFDDGKIQELLRATLTEEEVADETLDPIFEELAAQYGGSEEGRSELDRYPEEAKESQKFHTAFGRKH